MRGRMNAFTAGVLTAELRKRLAEANNTNHEPAAASPEGRSMTLGARALRHASLATAMHMAQVATRAHTGETPVPPTSGGGGGGDA